MIFQNIKFFRRSVYIYIYQPKANQKTERNYTFHLVLWIRKQ